MPSVIPADYYATASTYLDLAPSNYSSGGRNGTYSVLSEYQVPPKPNVHPVVYLYGICLVLIPTATILGNLLVIVSVLRFKALHSAINFLILGLAVADLFVALFVMPYAVYVYVQGGYWFLGPLMCDIYSASDVACSTASILLLAVISFDRYRAVSKPIQYSRQSQNIKRVVLILIVIWVISLALASPIVLGVNNRPADASPYECRFYNPEFSIMSSIVSFVIPCFIVLFVYCHIMIALRKREKAAKLRRQANQVESKNDDEEAGQIVAGPAVNVMMLALPSMTRQIRRYERHKTALENAGEDLDEEDGVSGDEGDEDDYDDDEELSDADRKDGDVFEDESEADLLEGLTDESVVDSGFGASKRRRLFSNGKRRHRRRRNRSSGADSLAACAVTASNAAKDDHDLAGSLTPRSSTDSLSENVNVVTNDFVSEGPTSMSRKSSDFDSSYANNTVSSLNSSNVLDRSDRSSASEFKRRIKNSIYFHRRSLTMPAVDTACTDKRASTTAVKEPFLPAFFRTISKRSPKIFRASPNAIVVDNDKLDGRPQLMSIRGISEDDGYVIQNSVTATPTNVRRPHANHDAEEEEEELDQPMPSSVDTETFSATATQATLRSTDTVSPTSLNLNQAIIRRTPLNSSQSVEQRKTSLPDCSLATTTASGRMGDLVIANEDAVLETPKHAPPIENKRLQRVQHRDECGSPSVSFNIAGKTFFGGRGQSTSSAPLGGRRRSSFIEISDSTKPSGSSGGMPSSVSSNVISSETAGLLSKNKVFAARAKPRHSSSKHSMDSNPSVSSSTKTLEQKRKLLNSSKLNGSSTALAVRIVKRTINRKESSLKRKVTKAQRKERRATKTLGIVVGIFLICWVPFFTINILNAVCVLIDQPSCQIGFGPFFYSTWIGYMNSFMNPVIYTIFNTEFRKAFKSLILGRNAARRHRARNV